MPHLGHRIRIGAVLDQSRYTSRVTLLRGVVYRTASVIIHRIHVASVLDRIVNGNVIIPDLIRDGVQMCPAIRIAVIRVDMFAVLR